MSYNTAPIRKPLGHFSKLPQVLDAKIEMVNQDALSICCLSVTLVGGSHDGKTLSQSAAFVDEEGFSTLQLSYLLREMAAQLEAVR